GTIEVFRRFALRRVQRAQQAHAAGASANSRFSQALIASDSYSQAWLPSAFVISRHGTCGLPPPAIRAARWAGSFLARRSSMLRERRRITRRVLRQNGQVGKW